MTDTSKLPISRVDTLLDKLEEINNKLDSMKYVVETGQSEDESQWYRIWSDGWIEQGGSNLTSTINVEPLTFVQPFTKLPMLTVCAVTTAGSFQNGNINAYNLTVTGFTKQCQANVIQGWTWYACGY